MPHGVPRGALVAVAAMIAALGSARAAEAQLGALLSPGRLARAHAELEGLTSCTKCHERGNRVSPQKCLTCHKPVADRIAARKGVHRDAASGCVSCHVDHAGADANLRPFDTAAFDHAAVTGFSLTDRHAPVAADCASCHKTRSFLTARPACSSCHADNHKGALGTTCETCHRANVAFAAARAAFDHATTGFRLDGVHRITACAACHTDATFATGPKGTACASCHRTPHPGSMSTTCTSCHTSRTWRTTRFDHGTTAFPLAGRHASVNCAGCHTEPATRVKPKSDTCATCHTDTHRGEFAQDCAACHDERGFSGASFDHDVRTTFALAAGHADLTCRQCHVAVSAPDTSLAAKVVDFRGLQTTCATCHADPHRAELGASCESCHSTATFRLTTFAHPRTPDFFAGQHIDVECIACHRPVAAPPGEPLMPLATAPFRGLSSTCATCHVDVHLGQVSLTCETCHSVNAEQFAPDRFRHDQTSFRLEGRHTLAQCETCHKREAGVFPAGSGTAVRLTGVGSSCATCHADPHLGQVGARCETCHSAATFVVRNYRHQSPLRGFFEGRHVTAECSACHRKVTADFPVGPGTAIEFDVDPACVSCHTDVHNGALGPDCIVCHKPAPLAAGHLRLTALLPEGMGR